MRTANKFVALTAAAFRGHASQALAEGGVDQAKAEVQKAEAMPHFVAPGQSFDMSKLKGKHVWIITSTLAVPFVATIAHAAEAAAKEAGLKTTLFDGKGDVTEWNRGMSQAVAQHADGIITVGASPELMKGPMAAALAAKIPVVDTLTADQAAPLVPGTFAHVSISFRHSGRASGRLRHREEQRQGACSDPRRQRISGRGAARGGHQHEFKTLCPDCAVTVQDTQVGNLGVKLGQLTQTLLRRSPDISLVMPTYDAQEICVVPAIKAANLDKPMEVIGSDAVTSNLDWIRHGNMQIADVGEPDVRPGWAAVDEIARAMLGLPSVEEEIPLRLFVAENLKDVPDDENALFGGDFVAQYRKLWGLR